MIRRTSEVYTSAVLDTRAALFNYGYIRLSFSLSGLFMTLSSFPASASKALSLDELKKVFEKKTSS
jgi:hypothetical protein